MIGAKDNQLTKSQLIRDLQNNKYQKIRRFELVDRVKIDRIGADLKRSLNQKNYILIVLEV